MEISAFAEDLTCDSCGKTYQNISDLETHITSDHLMWDQFIYTTSKENKTALVRKRKFPNASLIVGKSRLQKPKLEVHQDQKHTDSRSFCCVMCRKRNRTLNVLKKHLTASHADAKWDCHECGLTLKNIRTFICHLKQHCLKNKCHRCNTEFGTQDALDHHLLYHAASLSCYICKKAFAERAELKKHRKTCRQVYVCDHCTSRHSGKDSLVIHIRRNHFQLGDPVHCNQCPETFYYPTTLESHCSQVHVQKPVLLLPKHMRLYGSEHVSLTKANQNEQRQEELKEDRPDNTNLCKSLPKNEDIRDMIDEICNAMADSEASSAEAGGMTRLERKRRRYKNMFTEHALFPCRSCVGKRLLDLEVIKQPENGIVCVQCSRVFLKDITCHLHIEDTKIMCGFCSVEVNATSLSAHIFEHWLERSYLSDICSRACLANALGDGSFTRHPKYKCCYFFFVSLCKEDFFEHAGAHRHDSSWLYCDFCEKKFASNSILVRHRPICAGTEEPDQSTGKDPKRFRITYMRNMVFRQHLVNRYSNDHTLFPCTFCHLPRIAELELMPSHKDLTCRQCQRSMSVDIACHVHQTDNELVCGFCAQTLTKETANTHMKDHWYMYSCLATVCSVRCLSDAWKSSANRSKVKDRYFCYVCFQSRQYKDGLESHITKSHVPKSAWLTCDICDYPAYSKTKLVDHRRRCHEERPENKKIYRRFQCEFCHLSFELAPWLESHLTSVHKEVELICSECNLSLLSPRIYLNHMEKHFIQLKCGKCPRMFANLVQLQQHSQIHDLAFRCVHCKQEFQDKPALSGHSCDSKFVCAHCSRHFRTKANLRQHIHEQHVRLD